MQGRLWITALVGLSTEAFDWHVLAPIRSQEPIWDRLTLSAPLHKDQQKLFPHWGGRGAGGRLIPLPTILTHYTPVWKYLKNQAWSHIYIYIYTHIRESDSTLYPGKNVMVAFVTTRKMCMIFSLAMEKQCRWKLLLDTSVVLLAADSIKQVLIYDNILDTKIAPHSQNWHTGLSPILVYH